MLPVIAIVLNSTVKHLFLMDALRPFAKRLRYNAYYKRPEAIEPSFALFLTEPDASYAMYEVSEHTKISISTLYSWREKIRADPDWRPSPEHFSSNARTFPSEVEATLADFIRLHFVSQEGDQLLALVARPRSGSRRSAGILGARFQRVISFHVQFSEESRSQSSAGTNSAAAYPRRRGMQAFYDKYDRCLTPLSPVFDHQF
jgi:hypothetical protein